MFLQDSVVVQVSARDQDALSHQVQYSLSGDGNERFVVVPDTGVVTIQDNNDLAAGQSFLLQVRVSPAVCNQN